MTPYTLQRSEYEYILYNEFRGIYWLDSQLARYSVVYTLYIGKRTICRLYSSC